jgi:aldehyde:ferredoxin oxidoreductase
MARMVRLCDEMGIDTIDAGTLVAINMEVGKLPGAMPRLL